MTKVLYVGLDVHKESIVAATATAGDTPAELYGTLGGTLDALDKFIKKLARPNLELRFVYEAGPCGYVIYRHLTKRQLHCQVIAPSLIPTKASDRAMRDQCKARLRLKAFLLRLGHRYLGKGNWSDAHLRYLSSLKFTHAGQQIAFQEYLEAVTVATERLERLSQAMAAALPGWKREPVVRALMCLRGMALLTAMTLVAEAGDLTRFASPSQLMSYFGLTPSEYSSGEKRHQGGITKAGNGACRRALVETAQHYRVAPRVTPAIQKRQEGQPREVRAIALKAQQRLNGRFRLLTGRRKKSVVIIAALARELCGFVWAIACQIDAPERLKAQAAARTAAAPKPAPAKGRDYVLDRSKKYRN